MKNKKKNGKTGKSKKKIVVIGGGTGVFNILSSLRNDFEDLTAIVTMADDGGSTGILREEFGMLPPGDIRRALVALAESDNRMLAELFSYRFSEGAGLTGHNFGNLLITALHRLTGDFEIAIKEAGKILGIKGQVIPVTLQSARLMAELESGRLIEGETNIDIPNHDGRERIKKVWLSPAAEINPSARRAILDADLVIIGPGDLYTSLIPNLLVSGVSEALNKTDGKVAYFVNVMTKFGETHGFSASDFVHHLHSHLDADTLDFIVLNNSKPSPKRLRGYIRERAEFVHPDVENMKIGRKTVPISVDLIRSRGYIRHDPEKVLRVVKMLI